MRKHGRLTQTAHWQSDGDTGSRRIPAPPPPNSSKDTSPHHSSQWDYPQMIDLHFAKCAAKGYSDLGIYWGVENTQMSTICVDENLASPVAWWESVWLEKGCALKWKLALETGPLAGKPSIQCPTFFSISLHKWNNYIWGIILNAPFLGCSFFS